MCQRFQLDQTKVGDFYNGRLYPIDPHCKIAHFWQRQVYTISLTVGNVMIYITLTKVSNFSIGVYGKILCLLMDHTEISFLST